MSLKNVKILVTGATGFIGSRLIQWLVEVEKAQVVALVHNFKNASRISRYPIEMVRGDVLDPSSLLTAMKGCTHVVHAAVSFAGTEKQNRATTVDGARNVCEAAHRVGIKRVVYLSTISIYGITPPGVIDENTPCRPTDSYGQDKLDAELVFRKAAGTGIKPVILRLPVVYGPWSFWSTYPMDQFRQGRVVLPDEGSGICNAMYVDDAVQCIVCALEAETSDGATTCLVSGPTPITWRQFYEEHGMARCDKPAMLRFLPKSEILKGNKSGSGGLLYWLWSMRGEVLIIKRIPGTRLLLRALKSINRRLRTKQAGSKTSATALANASESRFPDVRPNPAHLELMASQSVIENRSAEKLFGFHATVSFAEGMEKTRAWLVWAGLGK